MVLLYDVLAVCIVDICDCMVATAVMHGYEHGRVGDVLPRSTLGYMQTHPLHIAKSLTRRCGPGIVSA